MGSRARSLDRLGARRAGARFLPRRLSGAAGGGDEAGFAAGSGGAAGCRRGRLPRRQCARPDWRAGRRPGAGLERLIGRQIGIDRQLGGRRQAPGRGRRRSAKRWPPAAVAPALALQRRARSLTMRTATLPTGWLSAAVAIGRDYAGAPRREYPFRSWPDGRRHGRACRAPLRAHPGCGRYRA